MPDPRNPRGIGPRKPPSALAIRRNEGPVKPKQGIAAKSISKLDRCGSIQELPQFTITSQRTNSSESWRDFIRSFGAEGYKNLVNKILGDKLAVYKSNFSIKVYGLNEDGTVAIPKEIISTKLEESKIDAMHALATAWAMQESGEDISSWAYILNPLAKSNFLNSYLQTGVSRSEAYSIIMTVGLDSVLAYVGHIKLSPFFKLLKGPGGKINGFSVGTAKGYGAQPRFDFQPIPHASRKMSRLTTPEWMRKNKVALPHYHRGKGKNLNYHRPWEIGPDGKRRW